MGFLEKAFGAHHGNDGQHLRLEAYMRTCLLGLHLLGSHEEF